MHSYISYKLCFGDRTRQSKKETKRNFNIMVTRIFDRYFDTLALFKKKKSKVKVIKLLQYRLKIEHLFMQLKHLMKIYSSITSKPINIQWIITGSQPY